MSFQERRFDRVEAVIGDGCPLKGKVRKVFELRCIGLSKQQIAERLHREISTINTQCQTALNEMEAHSVQEAIAKAVAEGWLTFKYVTKKFGVAVLVVGISASMVEPLPVNAVREASTLKFSRQDEESE